MTKDEKLKHCRGCGNDFYNGEGAKECWSLKDAKLITRYAIGLWTPMDSARNLHEVRKFDCYHERGSSRTVYMNAVPDHLRAQWNQLQREAKERAMTPQPAASENGR
jgi:hypothetical protein